MADPLPLAPFALRRLRVPLRAWAAARAMPLGVHDPAFLAMVHAIDGGPLHVAPPVRLLADGVEAFACMQEAMARAREEILLETYIMRDDSLGSTVQSALLAAVQRGVRVSVLVDAIGSAATADRFWEALEAGGVTVRHFHRLWHHPLEAWRRDHRKLLVVDRATAFTGGMNIGEEYGSSIRQHHDAWRDTFIQVAGSVARELAAVFAEGWDRARGPALPGLEYVSWSEGVVVPPGAAPFGARAITARVKRTLRARRDETRGRLVRREAGDVEPGRTDEGDDAPHVLVLDPRPGRGQREMLSVLAALVGGARERLWITTPYFAPPARALALLMYAAQRGVDVRLLLPSARTDVPLVRHAAHGAYRTLLAHGVKVHEYQRATLHAKTLVVDGYAGLVGSSNLDFRSFWHNAECNVLLFDRACGAVLEQGFHADLADSEEITPAAWAARSPGHRLLDRFARGLRWAL
jgi:cardiolipin synthase A/B